MKCEGRHTVHSNCLGVTGVIDWFVEKKHNTCPNCRHDFSDFFSTDIEANLEHRQPNGIEIIAHWSKPPNLRLAALNLLVCPNAVWTRAIRYGTERKDKRRQFTVAMDLTIQ